MGSARRRWIDLRRPRGKGVIARPVADGLRAAAGLRNRIAHGYAMLDYRRVQEESRAGIRPLRVFLEAVASAAGL